ncbi:MAG: methionyl-tRNA formyltransferase [Bacillota bacterium]|nr:methionyl-tRNA formyltransferase [Bacillota bacterium]
MKVIYMGTPDFAVPCLEQLYKAGHDISLVVTKADRPKDRGKKIQSCPVKLKALELGLNVISPENVKNNKELYKQINDIGPDFIVVAAYGKILPKEILDAPKFGCINIHGSLLPKYRGPAPIHRAIMDGETETGVTIMYMAEGCDTGDIIAMASTPVDRKTTEELHVELADLGAKLLVETLPKIADGLIKRIPQNDELATYAPMVFKEDGVIDFNKTATEIDCLVRGFNSWPVASTKLNGEVMKVYEVLPLNGNGKPGQVLRADKTGIEVACQGGSVEILRLQMPGKKAMDAASYLLGNKIEIGTILG